MHKQKVWVLALMLIVYQLSKFRDQYCLWRTEKQFRGPAPIYSIHIYISTVKSDEQTWNKPELSQGSSLQFLDSVAGPTHWPFILHCLSLVCVPPSHGAEQSSNGPQSPQVGVPPTQESKTHLMGEMTKIALNTAAWNTPHSVWFSNTESREVTSSMNKVPVVDVQILHYCHWMLRIMPDFRVANEKYPRTGRTDIID